MVVEFIGSHRVRFGVQPICRVLSEHGCTIAPSTYYAARQRAVSDRAARDAVVLVRVRHVHADRTIGRGVYGARKVWHQLRREGGVAGRPVPRCQVERLMRANNLRGAPRQAVHHHQGRPGGRRQVDQSSTAVGLAGRFQISLLRSRRTSGTVNGMRSWLGSDAPLFPRWRRG